MLIALPLLSPAQEAAKPAAAAASSATTNVFTTNHEYDEILKAMKPGETAAQIAKRKVISKEWTMDQYRDFVVYYRKMEEQAAIEQERRIG